MKNERSQNQQTTDMLLFLSTDASKVWLLPEISKKFGKEIVLKPYSRKRKPGETDTQAMLEAFKKHFKSTFVPKMENAGKIKHEGVQFIFHLASGQGISFPEGSICVPLSKVMKGHEVSVVLNKKQCKAKPTTVLSLGLELPASL